MKRWLDRKNRRSLNKIRQANLKMRASAVLANGVGMYRNKRLPLPRRSRAEG
jgi:hypothetical protein